MHQVPFSDSKESGAMYKLRISVMGLFTKSDTVLMIHKMTGPQPDRWDLPGGGLAPDEPLLHALRREIREETGIENFQVENLLIIAEDFFPEWAGRPLHSLSIIYKCSLEGNPLLGSGDPKEVGSKGIQWMPFTELSSTTCTTRSLKALEAAKTLLP
jgi:8-oxo-dGTP diphosphatase